MFNCGLAAIGECELNAAQWYVAPEAASQGAGSISSPWLLQTALTNPAIQPGDTVWLRNGVYFPTAAFLYITNIIVGWEPQNQRKPRKPNNF